MDFNQKNVKKFHPKSIKKFKIKYFFDKIDLEYKYQMNNGSLKFKNFHFQMKIGNRKLPGCSSNQIIVFHFINIQNTNELKRMLKKIKNKSMSFINSCSNSLDKQIFIDYIHDKYILERRKLEIDYIQKIQKARETHKEFPGCYQIIKERIQKKYKDKLNLLYLNESIEIKTVYALRFFSNVYLPLEPHFKIAKKNLNFQNSIKKLKQKKRWEKEKKKSLAQEHVDSFKKQFKKQSEENQNKIRSGNSMTRGRISN